MIRRSTRVNCSIFTGSIFAYLKITCLALILSACAQNQDGALQDINQALDRLHQSAAVGDQENYLDVYAPNAVFLGSAPDERWDFEQFSAYVKDRFKDGKGWAYQSVERNVFVSSDGNTAWFDEVIMRVENGQNFRGSGVLEKRGGAWKVTQYNFSVPFDNDLWPDVMKLIADHAKGTSAE